MFAGIRSHVREAPTQLGLLIWFVGFFAFVIGPTIIDPYGDGLWYGAISLLAGILIGYGYRRPD